MVRRPWLPGNLGGIQQTNGRAPPLAILSIAAEFLGSIGLILGCLTRIAALGIACTILVAAVLVHLRFGFFMNWFGNKPGNGVEYDILAIGMALSLFVSGGGMFSLDREILRWIGA